MKYYALHKMPIEEREYFLNEVLPILQDAVNCKNHFKVRGVEIFLMNLTYGGELIVYPCLMGESCATNKYKGKLTEKQMRFEIDLEGGWRLGNPGCKNHAHFDLLMRNDLPKNWENNFSIKRPSYWYSKPKKIAVCN